nr:acyltransferase [uncultured Actinoplanes sp.]
MSGTVAPALLSSDGHGSRRRVAGLEPIRGLAALYVVVSHCRLLTFPGYPANTGPGWHNWLLHGRLAVVVFITLSGFSLAIAPARDGWHLRGALRYARRRAWRILPPYWAALVFSLAIAATVSPLPLSDPPSIRSVVVYGLLMQDVVVAPVPNGAFWSIAVEAGLYFAFPLLLLMRRRAGAAPTLALITVPVVAAGLLHPGMSAAGRSTGFTVELAPLFTLGLVAAGILTAGDRIRRWPWHWLAALAATPVILLIGVKGSVWTVNRYYWVDLAIGPAIALLLAAVASRRSSGLMRLLDNSPLRGLGRISFSLYLIHLPIVSMISRRLVAPHVPPGMPAFWTTLVLAVPVAAVAAWCFAAVFERPFQQHRSWASLKTATCVRWERCRRPILRRPPWASH